MYCLKMKYQKNLSKEHSKLSGNDNEELFKEDNELSRKDNLDLGIK